MSDEFPGLNSVCGACSRTVAEHVGVYCCDTIIGVGELMEFVRERGIKCRKHQIPACPDCAKHLVGEK